MFVSRGKMVIEWRERENEVDDNNSLQDPDIVRALHECGLLKYLCIPTIMRQRELLHMLIRYQDPNLLMLIVDGERVPFGVEEVHFMVGLSRRGETLNL